MELTSPLECVKRVIPQNCGPGLLSRPRSVDTVYPLGKELLSNGKITFSTKA